MKTAKNATIPNAVNDLTADPPPKRRKKTAQAATARRALCSPPKDSRGTLETWAATAGEWTRPAKHSARPIEHNRNSAKHAPAPELLGVPVEQIVAICRVEASTARRWKRGATEVPPTALMMLRIVAHGELDDLGPEWRQWRYKDGTFWSPDKWRINRNDALCVPLLHQQIAALRAEKDALLEQIETGGTGLDEQPTPDSWQLEIVA